MSHSWDGVRYVSVSDWRSPSAIRGLRDFSSLRGASLASAAEDYFLSQSEVKSTEGGLEIYLNQFVITDQNQMRNFVCRVEGRAGVYDRVELRLRGLGISEAGKEPMLVVESDCLSEPDPKAIGAIRVPIPMAQIYELRPTDQYVRFYDDLDSRVQVVEMVSEWPKEWRLEEVRYFLSTDSTQSLSFKAGKKKGSPLRALQLSWPMEETSKSL